MEQVAIKNVTFAYPDGTVALKKINLNIFPGERVAIIGANGAGKSTLFQLFNGLLQPTSGEVLVNGLPVEKNNYKTVRRLVGMVFQDPDDQLFCATVKQEISYGLINLGLSGPPLADTIHWALQEVGLPGYENKNPDHLSGGEKKRVALASVLAMKPAVLVLDEPTAALDPRGAAQLVSLLNKINRELNITLVFATHDVDIVPLLSDRTYVMNRGELITAGTTGEVLSDIPVIRENGLRLPRVAHLAELLVRDQILENLSPLPLTIGQARKSLYARAAKLTDTKSELK